ncbi:hypothetical protein BSFP_055030 [Burkholderia stabilis]|uniref:Uncharacterized protein n=1 Tax=Burkholderia stabilis TaxID=95485 RepID=A0A1Y1BS65_9BURK|nr:hypothetical protein BSFP_055030 [Burkholderia stabilis]
MQHGTGMSRGPTVVGLPYRSAHGQASRNPACRS